MSRDLALDPRPPADPTFTPKPPGCIPFLDKGHYSMRCDTMDFSYCRIPHSRVRSGPQTILTAYLRDVPQLASPRCFLFRITVAPNVDHGPVFILGIHRGEYPPPQKKKKSYIPKNLSSFFLYFGLELSIVTKS